MRRPIGIWIIAILAIAAGVLYLAGGLQLMGAVTFSPAPLGNRGLVHGHAERRRGDRVHRRRGGPLVPQAAGARVRDVHGRHRAAGRRVALLLTGDVSYGLSQAILPAFMLWYANRPEIQEAFGF